jgi:hypothetical protein
MKSRVRGTSETVMGDTDIQNQRHRTRLIRKVSHELDVPTMMTPTFNDLLCFYSMCGVEKVSNYTMFIFKSIKRELKTRPIYDCRYDERLKPEDDEST